MTYGMETVWITYISTFMIGYLIGSIPFGLLLTKMAGMGDIRSIGSGNIGATNVLRTGNKKLALLTLILDGAKGAAAFFAAYLYFHLYDCSVMGACDPDAPCTCYMPSEIQMLSFAAGLAAIIGHCHPVWLKFKGGKGVATTLGTLLIAVPYTGLIACASWLLSAIISRISSLSALIAVLTTPLTAFYFYSFEASILCLLITILVWIKHAANIRRLLKGEEPKIGQKK